MALSPAVVISVLCVAEILSMTAFAMFPALQPTLRAEWRLSNTAAGWASGTFYFGYMLAVPVLTGLTDRVDPRRVWLASASLTLVSAAAFAMIADGLWSALLCQLLAGIGLAGTFMPGLKLLADLTDGGGQARVVSFYTTSFTAGSSLSYYLLGTVAEAVGWRTAVLWTAGGPAVALALVALLVPARAGDGAHSPVRARLDFRPVFRSAASMRFMYTYVTHMWELFAFRAWLVPFLTFNQAWQSMPGGWRPTSVAAIIALMGVPASIGGNEVSARFGRTRVVVAVMSAALVACVVTGLTARLPWQAAVAACFVYSVLINADSSALTSGLIASAPVQVRGATMALYSMAGYAGAFSGALVVGGVLDLLGGQSSASWAAAFVVMGLPGAAGLVWMRRSRAVGTDPPGPVTPELRRA